MKAPARRRAAGHRQPGKARPDPAAPGLGHRVVAASSVPTPLYALYAAQWGFSPLATTVVFGVHAVAVLASLLTFGKLSDHVGRRPVLLTGLVLQAVAMVLFATAGRLGTLLGARIVQGVRPDR